MPRLPSRAEASGRDPAPAGRGSSARLIRLAEAPAHVEVSLLDLEADGTPCAELERRLDDEERARARCLRSPVDRRRFVRRRAQLRELLGRALGRAPSSVRYAYGPWGKPSLADHALAFSTSHSAGRALVCLSEQAEVGCDIERIDPAFDGSDLERARVLTAGEARRLAEHPAEAARALFFEMWTLKEAGLKCLGVGLSRDAATLDTAPYVAAPAGEVSAASIALAEGFACAVAWKPRAP